MTTTQTVTVAATTGCLTCFERTEWTDTTLHTTPEGMYYCPSCGEWTGVLVVDVTEYPAVVEKDGVRYATEGTCKANWRRVDTDGGTAMSFGFPRCTELGALVEVTESGNPVYACPAHTR